MSGAVRVVDHGANALLRAVTGARPAVVKVGIVGSKASAQEADSGLTVAEVAEKHEFGIGVHRRSWLIDYVDANMSLLQARMRAIADTVVRLHRPERPGLEQFGQKAVGEIQERIAARIPPPLSDVTIAMKGSDVPLIDTGQLRSSISYIVENAGGPGPAAGGTP